MELYAAAELVLVWTQRVLSASPYPQFDIHTWRGSISPPNRRAAARELTSRILPAVLNGQLLGASDLCLSCFVLTSGPGSPVAQSTQNTQSSARTGQHTPF